ncbi:CocE/NonD family hydrolase [Nocardioides sp. W3-2-3]|nr:CocE/NonD family hydrolase [Nocardioides convexus]
MAPERCWPVRTRRTWSSGATPRLTVDARGTGTSEGQWAAFSAREGKDAGAIVNWAAAQPWSNGKVGMTGASYMGISQALRCRAAAAGPQGDLPAGARGRRLPRRGGLGRPDRRRLHPAVAGAGDRYRHPPAGVRRPGARRRLQDAHRPPRRRTRLHPAAGAGGTARWGAGLRRPVLRRALADHRDRQGEGADLPHRRRVRPVPARHPARLRADPAQRRAHQSSSSARGTTSRAPPVPTSARPATARSPSLQAAVVRPVPQGHRRQSSTRSRR